MLVPVEAENVPPVTVIAENSLARVAVYKLIAPVDSNTAVCVVPAETQLAISLTFTKPSDLAVDVAGPKPTAASGIAASAEAAVRATPEPVLVAIVATNNLS
jgi:hypothetical protein